MSTDWRVSSASKRRRIEDAISTCSSTSNSKFPNPDLQWNQPVAPGGRTRFGLDEFYEIKPDSDMDMRMAKKIAKISKLFRKLGLDYKPGDY